MAEQEIIQNIISRLGQSQKDRTPKELGIHFADVDERTMEDLFRLTQEFSEYINYYQDTTASPSGNWQSFFSFNQAALQQILKGENAATTPHLALFLAFLKTYKKPLEVINRITGRHLDFYYEKVLRLTKKPAVADKAHLLLELKKNASPLLITPDNFFSAGKDATGVELLYAPTGETIINTAKITSLRSLFLDKNKGVMVRSAPVANSSDGTGGALEEEEPKWHGFGYDTLPEAEVGFALASPVFRMQEGTRTVTVTLTLNNMDTQTLNATSLAGVFEAFITGGKGWLGPYPLSPTIYDAGTLTFAFTLEESEKAVIDYDAAIHGYSYTAKTPIVQILLKTGGEIGYNDFAGVTVLKAKAVVDVSKVTSLSLESDAGTLDPKKAFMPFGPQPTVGSRFYVHYDEAFSKKLSQVKITLQWKAAPAIFSTYYSGYGNNAVNNRYFKTAVSWQDGESWEYNSSGKSLFETTNASLEHILTLDGGTSESPLLTDGMKVYALAHAGSFWATNAANQWVSEQPVLANFLTSIPEKSVSFVTFSLETDFLHATYRKKYIEHVMAYSQGTEKTLVILNEPYTPTLQGVLLSYKAFSDEVNIASDSNSLSDFSNADIQFFHIAYFGAMREQGYQREQFGFLTDKTVSLLPVYKSAGALLMGFNNLKAGDSVSVLFQVAEGSADPDLAQEDISWYVLCDNYWKPLSSSEVVLDTTNQLLTSGIIQFVIPAEATTVNTILPNDLIWIKAAIAQNVTAVCQLIEVMTNAVETQFADNGNDPTHLLTALEAGKITKLKNGLSAVKSVKQPYASFGGRGEETDEAFYTRVSERLRHKDRCITAWDYERVVLEAFPKVHQVKAIPHAKEGAWLAPGNVLIVVVPDLKNKNAVDPLEPKVDAGTISQITSYVQDHIGMQVTVQVKNPAYQKIQLDFKVKFYAGYEFNYYSGLLREALIQFLSPWAYESNRALSFGGKVYKSVLLDFVEELDYVDYVTDFKMYSYTGETNNFADVNETMPETPDAILVSDTTHSVSEVI